MPSRPFDPQWTTSATSLDTFLDQVCRELASKESRKRRRSEAARMSFEAAIKAIVLDLYRAHLSNPDCEVGIASGQTDLQRRFASRYGAPFLSVRSFLDAKNCLLDAKLIFESTAFWYDQSGQGSRTARYKASPELLAGVDGAGGSLVVLKRREDAEGIVLKDANKERVPYGETNFSVKARDNLKIINSSLSKRWVDLALPDGEILKHRRATSSLRDEDSTLPFDLSARTLYRVFNNGKWDQGGRFYGAWWISLPSKLRKYVVINGKRTVEVDYSGLHATMLYANIGKEAPSDPYERCLNFDGSDIDRKLVKRTFNALLNASSKFGVSAMDGYDEQKTGKPWVEFLKFIVAQYPEFDDYFGTGIGVKLQFQDSILAERVMLTFAEKDDCCLPVHDSFLVHHALQDELELEMARAFQQMFGKAISLKLEVGLGDPPYNRSQDEEDKLDLFGALLSAQTRENPSGQTSGFRHRLMQFNGMRD